jgi:hypothetical protein
MAPLKSVEWMGFIEIGRKCQYQSNKNNIIARDGWLCWKSVEWMGALLKSVENANDQSNHRTPLPSFETSV